MKKATSSISKLISRWVFILSTFCFATLYAQNGYFQNFNSGGVPSEFSAEASYALSTSNQALRIQVNKGNLFHAVALNFAGPINLSSPANRKVSFRIRTDTTTRVLPFEIRLTMFNSGTSNPSGERRSQKVIYPTGKWQTISFDFNDPGFTANFGAITQMNIIFQPLNYLLGNSVFFIDDIAIGNTGTPGQEAIAAPYFLGIPNQQIQANTSFTYKIKNVVDADNLNSNVTFTALSSNTSILPNPTFPNSPFLSNSFSTFNSGNGSSGDLPSSRRVNMVMTPVPNQFGMVTVTVTATSASQIAGITSVPHRYVFNVDVRRNNPPTIGTLPTSLVIGSDKKFEFNVGNVLNNNGEVNQLVTISGLSSDQSVVQNSQIVASYNGIALDGKITITPTQFSTPAFKIFNLTINVRDNGGTALGASNQSNYLIPVTVFPAFYAPPTIAVVPNQIDNIITQGPRTIRIEPITDGNGGSRLSSIIARSGNTGILAHPTVSYTPGNNFALITYNSLIVGTTNISITATNFGAPSNSNGNSSFTRTFVMTALNPPETGYVEPFSVSTTVGAPENSGSQADGRFSTVTGTWYIEARNTIQIVSINSVTGTFTNIMDKPGEATSGYFSGVWYKPKGGGDLFDFASFPFLSVQLSASSATPSSVAIDLWDVNGKRYGLSSAVAINGTPTIYTFCYSGTPCVGNGTPGDDCGGNGQPTFDFSKVKTILFNFGVTPYNTGTGSWAPYQGTITMRDLRIGSSALGSGSCVLPQPNVVFGTAPSPFFTTAQSGVKTATIRGINAGSTPISGKNNNPVTLSINGSFSPSILSFNATSGVAVIQYTTGATAQTGTINLVGNASGSIQTTLSFNVTVQNPPALTNNVAVNNDLNANFSDGNKGQTIDGSPFGICEIFSTDGGSNLPDSYYEMLKDVNMQSMRIGIWDFEPTNDNNDPFVLDKSKLDYRAMGIDFFKKASDAGVKRFFVTFFSPPNFTKYNNSFGVPNAPFQFSPGFVVTNTVDSAYYEEYAEYAVAFVQGVKEKTGVDIYGLSLGNEIQFNQTYQSVVFNTQQYVEIVRRVGRRLAAAGLKTFIWGAETLQGQDSGNNYLKACQADPEVRNYFSGYAIHAYAANGVGQASPSWGNVVLDSRNANSNGGLTLLRQNPIATVGPDLGVNDNNPNTGEPHNGNGGIGIPIYQTETSQGGLSEADYLGWNNALGIFAGVSTSVNVGKNSGWYYIGINKNAKMYYTYKHIDKFVFGGARAIPVTQPAGTNTNAFRNPDGSVCILLATDNSGGMRTFSFGGVNMPTTNRAYLSVDENFWQDLGTITGSITVPPNAILTLWGGGNALVAANGVTVSGSNTTNVAGGSIQFTANVGPSNLVDKSVTWSVITNTGNAIVDQNGLMTAVTNGIVTIRATSVATPLVFGQIVVTISGQYVKLTALSVDGLGSVRNVATASTLQMTVSGVFPTTAPLREATWTLSPVSGIASINNSTGLLTGVSAGLVTVIGTSVDNNTVTGRVVVTVTSTSIPIASATVTGGSNQITTGGGTLSMTSTFSPANATSTTVGWSISGSIASINPTTGLVTALNSGNGVVTVTSTYSAWGITATRVITISGQTSLITSATIIGVGNSTAINIANGSLQMTVTGYLPTDATNTSPTWSVLVPALGNTINATGVLSATTNSNGVITVQAAFGAVLARRVITVSNQNVPVVAATINGVGGVNTISSANGTLQMTTTGLAPLGANQNTTPIWSVLAPDFGNTINVTSGLLQATTNSNGVITVQASFGSVIANRVITVSNQNVPVSAATIIGLGGINSISIANGTLQMTVSGIAPLGANQNTTPTWSVLAPALGNTINASGVLTATTNSNGVITVQAAFGSVLVTRIITVSNQNVPVTAATINGLGGVSAITSNLGTLQLTTTGLSPLGANQNTTPVWSLVSGSAASLNVSTGILTAINNGVVTVQGLFGSVVSQRVITVSNQLTGISITAGSNTITTNNGTIQMQLSYTPLNASVSGVNWSTNNANANVNPSGLVTGLLNGNVTVTATSIQNNAFTSSFVITMSNQAASFVAVTSVGLSGIQSIISTGSTTITTNVLPANATNPAVSWTLFPASGIASIGSSNSSQAIINGVGNGVFTVIGTSISTNSISGIRVITVSGFAIPVTSTTVNGSGGINLINAANGTLQMLAPYGPSNANSNTVLGWTMIDLTGKNTLSPLGLLTANNDGNGIVTITGSYGLVKSTRLVTISGQGITAISMSVNGSNISSQDGTSQMSVVFNPSNANVGTTVGWASSNGSIGSVNASGLVSAITNGVVTITGTTGVLTSIKVITISGQFVGIPVTSTTVNGLGGLSQILSPGGTLQMLAPYTPANSNQNTLVGWTLNDITGKNSINASTGLLQANVDGNGVVTVTGSYGAVISKRLVTISGQGITATSMTINGSNITVLNGTSQMTVSFGPVGANVGTIVGWTSIPSAKVNGSGLVSANGTNEVVTIIGTAGALSAIKVITISGQIIPVNSISLSSPTNQLVGTNPIFINANVLPLNASNPNISWSVMTIVGGGKASVSNIGVVQGLNNGDGVATIVGSALDGSNVKGYFPITVSGQLIDVTSLSISGLSGNVISIAGGSVSIQSFVLPLNASNTQINWTLITVAGQGKATINSSGFVTALENGNGLVTVVGTSVSNPLVSASLVVSIFNQRIPMTNLVITASGQTISTNGGVSNIGVLFSPFNTTDVLIVRTSPRDIVSLNAISTEVTAMGNGVVTITAVSSEDPNITSSVVYTVSGQYAKSQTITFSGTSAYSTTGGVNILTTTGGSIQMISNSFPASIIPDLPIWSISGQSHKFSAYNNNNLATINSTTGILTASNFGVGLITVTSLLPLSGITSQYIIEISNQINPVLIVNGGANKTIALTGDSVKLDVPRALPSIATNDSVTYSLVSGIGLAIVKQNGTVIATDGGNGIATVRVASFTNPNVFSDVQVSITGQSIGFFVGISNGAEYISIPIVNTGDNAYQLDPIFSPDNNRNIPFNRYEFVSYSSNISGIVDINTSSGVALMNILQEGVTTITATYLKNPSLTYMFVLTVVPYRDLINIKITSDLLGQRPTAPIYDQLDENIMYLFPVFDPIVTPTTGLVEYTTNPTGVVEITEFSSSGVTYMTRLGDGTTTVTGTYKYKPDSKFSFVVTVGKPNSLVKSGNSETVFELSPVPANDLLYLNTSSDLGNSVVKIYNAEGRIVAEYNFNSTSNVEMNVSKLSKGFYNLVLSTKNGVVSKPFVK